MLDAGLGLGSWMNVYVWTYLDPPVIRTLRPLREYGILCVRNRKGSKIYMLPSEWNES